jgi:hypothetical protein
MPCHHARQGQAARATMMPTTGLALALFAPTLALGAPLWKAGAPDAHGVQCNNASGVLTGHFYGATGYKIVPAESAAECCGLCAGEPGKCKSWTWGHGDRQCHMKSAEPSNPKRCAPPCACGPPASDAPTPTPGPAPVPPQPAGPARGPNILLLFPDQWRFDWDGFERSNQPDIPGAMLHVPTTRSVAARGTRFTTAYVPAPVCAPSRSCLAVSRTSESYS